MSSEKNKGIPNIIKFIFLIALLAPIVFLIAKKNHEAIEAFEVNGNVVQIVWNSRDHGMPIISIKQGNQVRLFKSNRITLVAEDVIVGDSFVKIAGSKECKINNKLVRCIN